MFGPKSFDVLIFEKTKVWWENLKKIHIPEERSKYSQEELMELAKRNQMIRMDVINLQLLNKVPLKKMVSFQKLTKAFFKYYPYSYGKALNTQDVEKK